MGRRSDFVATPSDIEELEDLVAAAERRNDLKLHRRARGLLMVARDGMTRREAAERCDVNESCLYDWQRRYERGGIAALETQLAPGAASRLTPEEIQRFVDFVESGPEAAGFDTSIWTTPQLQKLIRREFGQEYSISHIGRMLRKLKFSFQLPKIRLAHADPEAQRLWSEERFPALKERAERENGVIFLRTSPSSSNQEPRPGRGRGWVRA